MIKVVIADDHPLVKEGLKKVVKKGTIDMEVVAEASDGDKLLELLHEGLPDIVILDIAMPGRSGLDVLKDIKDRYPDLPVLILSMHPEDRFAIRALKSGAAGYLTKTSISDELINAIRRIVTKKRRYISTAVAEQLATLVDKDKSWALHENLSDREFQILCMIASGKQVNDIAEELSLKVQTVHTYRSRLKEKMNLKSNVEITRYALQNGLID